MITDDGGGGGLNYFMFPMASETFASLYTQTFH